MTRVAIALSVTIALAAAPARAEARSCGDLPAVVVSDIRAQMVGCKTARSLARRYVTRAACYQGGCSLAGYRCKRRVLGYESYRARCTRDSRLIRFDYGA